MSRDNHENLPPGYIRPEDPLIQSPRWSPESKPFRVWPVDPAEQRITPPPGPGPYAPPPTEQFPGSSRWPWDGGVPNPFPRPTDRPKR